MLKPCYDRPQSIRIGRINKDGYYETTHFYGKPSEIPEGWSASIDMHQSKGE